MTLSTEFTSLKNRVVIVTGGGQGIGRNHALRFAEQGAIPVIAEYNGENAEKIAAEITQNGGRALAIQTDVGSLASATAMAETTLTKLGRIDCLINNAALFSRITMAPFWQLPPDEWERAMQVNITGAFYCARAVVPAMQQAKWGRIINVSSATVLMGAQNYLHYVTSKSAVIGMTRSMARELGEWNITVNTFWPGPVRTEVDRPSASVEKLKAIVNRQCLGRMGELDDMSNGVLFLCSDDSGYITGQSLQPDGGLTHL